jgi:hypothetical protein
MRASLISINSLLLRITLPFPVIFNTIVPVNATADVTGTVTVIQDTQSLSAVCFKTTIPGSPSVVRDVDPLSKAMQTPSIIQPED